MDVPVLTDQQELTYRGINGENETQERSLQAARLDDDVRIISIRNRSGLSDSPWNMSGFSPLLGSGLYALNSTFPLSMSFVMKFMTLSNIIFFTLCSHFTLALADGHSFTEV